MTTIAGTIDMASCTSYADAFKGCAKLTGLKIKNPPADTDWYTTAGLTKDQFEIVT